MSQYYLGCWSLFCSKFSEKSKQIKLPDAFFPRISNTFYLLELCSCSLLVQRVKNKTIFCLEIIQKYIISVWELFEKLYFGLGIIRKQL